MQSGACSDNEAVYRRTNVSTGCLLGLMDYRTGRLSLSIESDTLPPRHRQPYYREAVTDLDTPRLHLRPLTKDDQPLFVELFADRRVTRYLALTDDPMQPEWAVSALDRNLACWKRYGYGPFAAIHKETGRWVGKIGLMVHEDWSGEDKTEVGWQLDPEFWGRGLATEGGTAAIHHGFAELDLPRIISVTPPKNVASWRVMEKCGLKRQGNDPLAGGGLRLVLRREG